MILYEHFFSSPVPTQPGGGGAGGAGGGPGFFSESFSSFPASFKAAIPPLVLSTSTSTPRTAPSPAPIPTLSSGALAVVWPPIVSVISVVGTSGLASADVKLLTFTSVCSTEAPSPTLRPFVSVGPSVAPTSADLESLSAGASGAVEVSALTLAEAPILPSYTPSFPFASKHTHPEILI